MIRNCIILIICTISFLSAQQERSFPRRTQPPSEIAGDLLTKEQQLVYGLTLLNRRQMLQDDGYSYYLRELLNITGFSALEAKEIMAKYRNDPQKYLLFLEKIRQYLVGNL